MIQGARSLWWPSSLKSHGSVLRTLILSKQPLRIPYTLGAKLPRLTSRNFHSVLPPAIINSYTRAFHTDLAPSSDTVSTIVPSQKPTPSDAYLSLISTHIAAGEFPEVIELYRQLIAKSIPVTPDICRAVLSACVSTDDASTAADCIQSLQGYLSKEDLRLLVNLIAGSNDIEALARIVRWFINKEETMLSKEIKLDEEMWIGLLHSSLRLKTYKRWSFYISTLLAVFEKRFSKDELSEAGWIILIRTHGVLKSKILRQLIDELPFTHPRSQELNESIIVSLLNSKLDKNAKSTFDNLVQNHNFVPSSQLFMAWIREYAYRGDTDSILALKDRFSVWIKDIDTLTVKSKWKDREFNLYSVLLRAHQTKLAFVIDQYSSYVSQTNRNWDSYFTFGTSQTQLYEAWERDLAKLKELHPSIGSHNYNQILRYHVDANFIDPKRFPMAAAENIINEMQEHGLTPTYWIYFELLRGYSRTREFDSDDSGHSKRLTKAINVLLRMETANLSPLRAGTFFMLFLACLPHNKRYNFDNFLLRPALPLLSESHPRPPDIDRRLFLLEHMMLEKKIPHNSQTFQAVLTCFGATGRYESMWHRWHDLINTGITPSASLYTRIFALSSLDPEQAHYALVEIRPSLKRAVSEHNCTLDLYRAQLDCCIASHDAVTAREIMSEMRHLAETYHAEKRKENPSRWMSSPRFWLPLVRTCLSIPVLHNEGAALLKEMDERNFRRNEEIWMDVLYHLVQSRSSHSNIAQAFAAYTMCRNPKIPIPATAGYPVIPFPSAPYSPADVANINLYLESLLREQDLAVIRGVLETFCEELNGQPIPISRKWAKNLMNLALKEKDFSDAIWILEKVLPNVKHQSKRYRYWVAGVRMRVERRSETVWSRLSEGVLN